MFICKINCFYVIVRQKKGVVATKVTSKALATKTSKAHQDGRSSARTKSIDSTALSQRPFPGSVNLGHDLKKQENIEFQRRPDSRGQ